MKNQHKNHSEIAANHLVTRVSTAKLTDTVGDILKKLQDPKAYFDSVDYTYILAEDGTLKGIVSIKELLNASDSDPVIKLMKTKFITAHPHADQELVANLALEQNIKAMPIVDKNNHFIGVVPSDTILNVLQWEHNEDLMRFSGVPGTGKRFGELIKNSTWKMSKLRIPSLLIGLLGGLFATSVVDFFEVTLQENLILAFFIPLVVYINNAVGSQTQTILVRTLAIEKVKIGSYIMRELSIGLILGSIIATTIFVIAYLWYGAPHVAATIGLSILIGISMATLSGILIPYTLQRMNKDPAISGGPFAAVLQDIMSLVIYFSVAVIIL